MVSDSVGVCAAVEGDASVGTGHVVVAAAVGCGVLVGSGPVVAGVDNAMVLNGVGVGVTVGVRA